MSVDGLQHPPPASAATLLAKAWAFVAPQGPALFGIVALSLGSAAIGACEPVILKSIFDVLAGAGGAHRLFVAVAVLGLALALRETVALHLDRRTWRVRIAVHESLTRATVERLHSLPLAYHERESVGAVLAKMDRGISGSVAAFSEVAFQMVPTLAYLAMSVVFMLRLDWRVAAVVCAFVPLPPLVSAWAATEQVRRERTLLRRWTGLFARLGEVLAGMAVVKSFALEDVEKGRFLSGVRDANGIVLRGVEVDSRSTAARNAIVALARIAAIALGGWYVARGELSLGSLVAFLGYLGALFGPVQSLAGMLQTLRRGVVGLEAVFSILDAPDPLADAPDAVELPAVRGDVEFRSVWFGYRPEHPVVRGVELRVPAGETVALVGPSGSGKTTLMTLLQRLYDPERGQVRIDGFDLSRVTQRSLRRHVGVVLQDTVLFNDSVRDNIALGRPGASIAEIERAARDAHAHEFIVGLPQGYGTLVGDRGAFLSTGQRQRIAIARALLKDPAVLILDEATSALDAESEALVQDAMARLEKGRTTFVVAHRLATVTAADRILVLRDGCITESGSHEQLMATSAYYAGLVRRQSRGLLPDAP